MSNSPDRMLAAQEAIRAGDKQQARDLLSQELQRDPKNFRAWLWLAGLESSPQASLDYVRQAERLNSRDPGVKKARAWAEQRLARTQASVATASSETVTTGEDIARSFAPPSQGTATRRLDALRQEQRAAGDEDTPAPRRHKRILIPVVATLAITVVAAALLWPRLAGQWTPPVIEAPAPAADDSLPPATPTPPASAAQPESDLAVISFVSGQFAPQAIAHAPEVDDRPPAETTATPETLAVHPKPLSRNENDPRPTWTLTPSPTFTPTATPSPVPTFVHEDRVVGGAARPAGVGPNERWIDVNLSTQTLVAYEGDRAVFNTRVSSGTWRYPTVTGQFRVWLRYTAQTMDGRRLGYDYYLPNVPYVMYFYRDYALHGTYWHNNFGTPMSHGCVNLPTPAAEWIFNWSSIGTLVNVHY